MPSRPEARPGGGIVWVAVGGGTLAVTFYAIGQLGGIEPDIARLAFTGIGFGLVAIVLGASRELAFPDDWRPPAYARRLAVLAAGAAVVVAVDITAGTDWAALAGLLVILAVPLGWRAVA